MKSILKTIHIEPDEEIISVIDKIDRANTRQIGLVIPKGAQIWQSSINLKLLKREADHASQQITLIIPNDLDSEMAERIGFQVKKVDNINEEIELVRQVRRVNSPREAGRQEQKKEKDFPVELITSASEVIGKMPFTDADEQEQQDDQIQSREAKKNMIEVLVKELKSDKLKNKFGSSFRDKLSRDKQSLLSRRQLLKNKTVDDIDPAKLFSKKSSLSIDGRRRISEQSKLRQAAFKKQETKPVLNWTKLFAGFIVLGLILITLVAYFVLPAATINIYPQVETINFDLSVVGSKDVSKIDTNLNRIPLQEITIEKNATKTFETTGEKELNEKARGVITIYNEYSSSPQSLVATTRFETSDGKIFRLLKNVVIPGAKVENTKIIPSVLDAEVAADSAGAGYNIGSSDFTIPGFKGSPKYVGFYGKSKEAMIGGAVGRLKVVLSDDLKKAEESLSNELLNNAKVSLQDQVPEGFELLDGGFKEEITQEKFSVKEGEPADSFTLQANAKILALLIKTNDVQKLIDLNSLAHIAEDKKILSDSQKFKSQNLTIDWSKGEAKLTFNVQKKAASDIDIAVLKNELAGKNEVEVRKYFTGHSEIQKANFSFWPFWVKRIPKRESRIKVIIKYDGDN